MTTTENKFNTVIGKNTFYFFDSTFEEGYEGHLNAIKEQLLLLKNEVEASGKLRREPFEQLLQKENGLTALLALTGFSNESLKRLITLIRVLDNAELSRLTLKDQWCSDDLLENVREWTDRRIELMIQNNMHFRKGLVNLFFEGATVPILANTVPLFELKKLSISKLKFEVVAMIDTLVRYKEKGSYSGKKGNNPEIVLEKLLAEMGLPFEKGELSELVESEPTLKRTMDFIIPNKQVPRVIIECSFLTTTSSGQGDKSKTEIGVSDLIKVHYPHAKFVGFVDGIGWYVRKQDLRRMVEAYEDVFTFHNEQLLRFEKFLRKEFQNGWMSTAIKLF